MFLLETIQQSVPVG